MMSDQGIKCLGNPILLSVLTASVVLLSAGCSSTNQSISQNSNKSVQVNAELPSGGDLIEIDFYEFADKDIGDLIKEISPKLGFAPLVKTVGPKGFEFRIWTNLGALADPKLLGVRLSGTETKAYLFEMDRRAERIKSRRDKLASPKSGWNKMLFEVRSRLTTPRGLVRDPQFRLGRDEPVIALEVLDKDQYRRVIYGKHTSFSDGLRLIAVCDYLSAEFDINMSCRK